MTGPVTRPHQVRPAGHLRRFVRSPRLNTARLVAPRPAFPLVRRPRLEALLDGAAATPVTLVGAPAGWGKTTLVGSWLAADPRRRAVWLTAGGAHNDPACLWRYLVGALSAVAAPGFAQRAPYPVHGPALADEAHAMVDELPPTVLVVDDAHKLGGGPAVAILAALARPPSPVRLVVCARGTPPLPVARLASAGELCRIGAADLAFTPDEARALADGQRAYLPPEALGGLVARTEGWAVGLRLSLMEGDGATGAQPFAVDDYFREEVLADLPADVRAFLLRTAVLDDLTTEGADAVTGGDDAARIIDRLGRDDVFTRRGSPPRYHPMFRDFLRREGAARVPGELPDLHRRASRWYAERGGTVAAARHALAAGEPARAADLLVSRGATMLFGPDRDAVRALLERVAADDGTRRPDDDPTGPSALALAAMCRHDPAALYRHAGHARALVAALAPDERVAAGAVLDLVDGVAARWRGDLSVDAGPDGYSDSASRAFTLVHRGLAELWDGGLDTAETTLAEAATATRAAGLDLALVDALGHAALIAALHGRLREAATQGREAMRIAGRYGWTRTMQSTPAFLGLAVLHCQRDDLDGAELHLRAAREGSRQDPERTTALATALVEARIRRAAGDQDGAARAWAGARRAARGWPVPRLLGDWLALVGADVELGAGRPARALDRIEPLLAGDPGPLAAQELVAAARARLALHQPSAARDLLARAIGRRGTTDLATRVEGRLLDALAADRLGHDGAVAIAVAEALEAAAPEVLLRPFRTAGSDLGHLLRRHHDLLAGAGVFGARVAAALTPGPGAPGDLLEPVTAREAAVARYLPTLLTITDIAGELYVSANTVKSHLRSLYRKLGVGNRRDAVYAARRLGLL